MTPNWTIACAETVSASAIAENRRANCHPGKFQAGTHSMIAESQNGPRPRSVPG